MSPEEIAERYADSMSVDANRELVADIEESIREAIDFSVNYNLEIAAEVAASTAPHAGNNCGCGECTGANSAADAIRGMITATEPPAPSPPHSDGGSP